MSFQAPSLFLHGSMSRLRPLSLNTRKYYNSVALNATKPGPRTPDSKWLPKSFTDWKLSRHEDIYGFKNKGIHEDITVVTAYFDLGRFQKGEYGNYYTPNLYRTWMKQLGRIKNVLVAYLEKDQDIRYIKSLRAHLPSNLTIINRINREKLWSFSLKSKIKAIYDSSNYPKHHPNTVIPEYSCAMHAKYEVIRQTILENPGKSKYIAWIDIGLYREYSHEKFDFKLKLPKDFNDSHVSFSEVYHRNEKVTPKQIILGNHVWVGGATVLGTMDAMLLFSAMYMRFVEYFIQNSIMNTDQQVIYAAANLNSEFRNMIKVYRPKPGERANIWFYLGILCKWMGQGHK